MIYNKMCSIIHIYIYIYMNFNIFSLIRKKIIIIITKTNKK